jgi:Zn-finger nucleic acid-binding protein
MKCPKCASEMSSVELLGVEVECCPVCAGVLLDKGEAELIEEKRLAAAIDSGRARGGASTAATPAHCHVCDRPMIALVGAGDIEFDWCEGCERLFFDAGELKAFTEAPASE